MMVRGFVLLWGCVALLVIGGDAQGPLDAFGRLREAIVLGEEGGRQGIAGGVGIGEALKLVHHGAGFGLGQDGHDEQEEAVELEQEGHDEQEEAVELGQGGHEEEEAVELGDGDHVVEVAEVNTEEQAGDAAGLDVVVYEEKQENQGDNLPAWRVGRATYYGDEHWLWSIHEGSCGYGNIWEDEPLGWDVAAIPDVHYEYAGSCGACYEVACNEMGFSDNFGNYLDRSHVCRDSTQSVVVRITDTCPCNYATNSYSNKRWCCGDMDHFDLSVWAFEKLAETKWGVIALKYRPVPCDHQPSKPAPMPEKSFPKHEHSTPRPWWLPQVSDSPDASSATPQPVLPHNQGEPKVIYAGGFQNNWSAKQWNARRTYGWKGPSGNDAFCAEVTAYGAMGFESHGGDFTHKVSMEMWIRTEDGVPDVKLQLLGNKECGMLKLNELQPTGDNVDGYSRYLIYLGLFDFGAHQKRVTAFASDFRGCGGNSAGEVKQLYVRNDSGNREFVCIDNVKLL